ncbi:MAG: Flp pilus assembly protein CpaB [Planctomycetaceae bacterium]|nr:Flp pilus assembly protein CpaB [Planctomycetaceae bacterium]
MQSKSLILLIFALACGVFASVGITRLMANRTTVTVAPDIETLPVFVVKEDIPLGNVLIAEKLKLEQWPKDKVPEGVLGKLEDIEGRRPRTRLFAGEPVLDVKLLSKGESAGGAAPQIPVGYRSVPVKVDEVSGGAAMILPGDRVDILVYAKGGGNTGIRRTMTKTILQDIKVFAVDSTWTLESDESGKSIRAKTISLLLTPEQTERVMLAHELGKLRLALRSPNDHEEADVPDEGHQVAQIFGDSEIADTEKDSVLSMPVAEQPQATAVTVSDPKLPSHTVRVINGSQVREVLMQGPSEMSDQEGSGSQAPFQWKIVSKPASSTGQQANPNQTAAPAPVGGSPSDVPTVPQPGPAEPADSRAPVIDD